MTLILWFTGLSGSGKTTICNELSKELENILIIDGDEIRKVISRDLGYTKQDRDEHILRVIEYVRNRQMDYNIILVSVISPTRWVRDFAREKLDNFNEIYIKCPVEICISRNPKGLYNKNTNIVGLDIPYEEPTKPELIIETDKLNLKDCILKIRRYINDITF